MNNYNQNNSHSDEQDFTYRTLFRNYISYIHNSNQFLNTSLEILANQQTTYNNLIIHYNTVINPNGVSYDYNLNRRRYYPYRPSPLSRYTFPFPRRNIIVANLPNSAHSTEDNYRVRPSVDEVANAISYHVYENIDISTNTTCPITQRDFTQNDTVVMINSCRHIFDPMSILSWFARCDSCPLCRASITRNNIHNEERTEESAQSNQNTNQDQNTNHDQNTNQDDDEMQVQNDEQENNNANYSYYTQFLNQTRLHLESLRNTIRNSESYNDNFSNNLAEIIRNEINRDLDFSGNILIELGINPR